MARPSDFIPALDELAALPIDEVAMRLLAFFASEGPGQWMHARHIVLRSMWAPAQLGVDLVQGDMGGFLAIISSAWAWLVSRGLIGPSTDQDLGWYMFTQRGVEVVRMQRPAALARIRAEERLDVDLHPILQPRVRRQFLLGEYELAAFAALREVEIRVRGLGGYNDSDIGVKLMQTAFGEGGPLRKRELDRGEAQAMMALFWGALGVFKNPSSHRQVDFADPTLAAEVVLLADLLLRLLDRQKDA